MPTGCESLNTSTQMLVIEQMDNTFLSHPKMID
jgi:hypothetical protein